jgi:hypothetical protein
MKKTIAGITLFAALISNCLAADNSQFGVSLSLPLITKDPSNLHGYRIAALYQPSMLIVNKLYLYFDVSYGHWWVNNVPHHCLNIIAIAPIVRYYFALNPNYSPFITASLGFSYLSKTRLSNSNLGIHFAFQDQLGVGVAFGAKKQYALTLSALHYSNGSMSAMNAGITAPLMLTGEYRFG